MSLGVLMHMNGRLKQYKKKYDNFSMEKFVGIARENKNHISISEGSGFGSFEINDGTDHYINHLKFADI